MPRRNRPNMYNTPPIRNAGFGALQVEALTNRPLSISRRHLAASQLRMRDIEPDELSSSEWVRFLVMEERERDRWMTEFRRRRRNSAESSGSNEFDDLDGETAYYKAEEARLEALEAAQENGGEGSSASAAIPEPSRPNNNTPMVSLWARQFEDYDHNTNTVRAEPVPQRPLHMRRAMTTGAVEAPPAYEDVRAHTPPPAYAPAGRSHPEDGAMSPPYSRVAFEPTSP